VDNPYLEVDKAIVSEIYTSSEPMDNLKVLCDVYGSRFGGTPGDFGSVRWMVEKLRSYGCPTASETRSRQTSSSSATAPSTSTRGGRTRSRAASSW